MAEVLTPRQRADEFVERSTVLADLGRWKDAEAQARRAIEADPTYAHALLQLAYILLMQGRWDEAAQLAKGALALDPTSSWAVRILCSWHGAHGRHAEAVAHAEQAVRLSDGDNVSLYALSRAKQNAGDVSGARIAAERLVSSFPDWPEGFVRLAETRHSPEEAVQAYREALRLDPHCDTALAGLAGLSGSLAQYREAVSLAWSSLRSAPTDKARQRLFVRSAWVYLFLSRIVAPLRGTHQALAESFGEACAFAFHATGDTLVSRLLFAFRMEAIALAIWLMLAVAMITAGFLPSESFGVLVPLLGIPVFLGLAVPFFLFFRGIAAARRLVDLRIIQWGGRGSFRSLAARAAVSGSLMVVVAVALLLAFPSWANVWGWLLLIGLVLAVQDLFRWRDQWRDSRQTAEEGSIRRALAASFGERAVRWFTPGRLAAFAVAVAATDIVLLRTVPSPDSGAPFVAMSTAAFALAVVAIDWAARRFAGRLGSGPRAPRLLAFGRSLVDLAWMITASVVIVILGGRLIEGAPIEALFPIFLLPFLVGSGWLVLRAIRAMLMLMLMPMPDVSFRERVVHWFTPKRLATISAAAGAIEIALLHFSPPHDPRVSLVAMSTPAIALVVVAIDWVAKRLAGRLGPGPREHRLLAFGRSLVDLTWVIVASVAIVILGGGTGEGAAAEALFPIFLLPFIVGGIWLALRAIQATLMLMVVAAVYSWNNR